jgi:diacylglycerol kinase family enzyme
MNKYQISFLINPIAGGELGAKVFQQLPEIMDSFGYAPKSWQAQFTDPDKLEEQTQRMLQCSHKLIAVGGDGTIGLVLDQLKKQSHGSVQIGLIPMGTGNDLARSLGVFQVYQKRGLLAVLKRLIRAQATTVHLWTVNGNYTLAAYLSVGIDAAIVHQFTKAREEGRIWKGALFNKLYYAWSFISSFHSLISPKSQIQLKYRNTSQEVNISDHACCLIGNINYYAGGAHPFPSMCLSEDALRVLTIKYKWAYICMVSLSRIIPLSRYATWLFPVRFAHEVTIHLPSREYIQLDGEDLTETLQAPTLHIQYSHSVSLLDLRKAPFHIFPKIL